MCAGDASSASGHVTAYIDDILMEDVFLFERCQYSSNGPLGGRGVVDVFNHLGQG